MCQKWVQWESSDSNDWRKLLGNCDWASETQRVIQFAKVVDESNFIYKELKKADL